MRPVIKLVGSGLELRTSYVLTKVDVERLSEPKAIDQTSAVTWSLTEGNFECHRSGRERIQFESRCLNRFLNGSRDEESNLLV